MNNSKNCDIVRDILPLYLDSVCSDSSRRLVEEHLAECADCTGIMKKMQNTSAESSLAEEKSTVLQRQAKAFRRRGAVVGGVIAGILMIPVLVCMIVNLAAGHALDWFFIVLASLMVFASLTVVPLVAPDRKFLWTLGSFTFSLLLLLAVCCIYSGGRWFAVAASSVLFGLSVLLLPAAVRCAPLSNILGNNKLLFTLAADTVLFFIMLACTGVFRGPESRRVAFAVSLPALALIWSFCLILRYVKANGLVRAGLCFILVGAAAFFADWITGLLLRVPVSLPECHLADWNYYTLNGNILWVCLFAGLGLGAVFIAAGILRSNTRKEEK